MARRQFVGRIFHIFRLFLAPTSLFLLPNGGQLGLLTLEFCLSIHCHVYISLYGYIGSHRTHHRFRSIQMERVRFAQWKIKNVQESKFVGEFFFFFYSLLKKNHGVAWYLLDVGTNRFLGDVIRERKTAFEYGQSRILTITTGKIRAFPVLFAISGHFRESRNKSINFFLTKKEEKIFRLLSRCGWFLKWLCRKWCQITHSTLLMFLRQK